MIHWVTQYYNPKEANKERLLQECRDTNLGLSFIEKATFLTEGELDPMNDPRVEILQIGRRARYSDFLQVASKNSSSSDIILLSNSDIILTDDILRIAKRITMESTVIALTRRELDGSFPKLANLGWTQDAWMIKAQAISSELLDLTQISLGIAGCENIFAANLVANAFNIWNPSLDITTIHNDPDPSFNYNDCTRYYGFYIHPMPCKCEAVERDDPIYEAKFRSKFFEIEIQC
jgi:hypothetical protein